MFVLSTDVSLLLVVRMMPEDSKHEVLATKKCSNQACQNVFADFGDQYKTLCMECYKIRVRKCQSCSVNNLRVDAPAWVKVCTSCFIENKQKKGYGTCPMCPPERMHHHRRPMNQPYCNDCAQKVVDSQRAQGSSPAPL